MNLSPTHQIKLLEMQGFEYRRTKGSHRIYFNSITNKTVIVPVHGGRDMKKGTFLDILKQAGIKNEERL